ncbi:MAG: efflux RND transporter periplasmic adaptor subunit [Patescibacteria group bacterium]|nr:efflux RND transporter periplasmic adaptor subunit [Patescibacteria group bacterium]MDD3778106.1 efflux RND transporter periplasmic adaptor subunit [Patescibacteria group bacterium]MDD4443652.1 efflux RND transporter periplasmic adaptor subunit [Patescibacteria group bacterium]
MSKKRKKWLYILIAIILLIVIIVFFSRRKPEAEYSTEKASYNNIIQTVSEVGTVKPVQELSLNFLNSGKIGSISVEVGQEVASGEELAALEFESLNSKKLEATAGLNIAEANLSKVLAGASSETVAVSQSELAQAKAAQAAAVDDLNKTKATVAENIRQAEKSLADLKSSSLDTPTAAEQAVYTAEVNLDNTKTMGEATIQNSQDSALLILDDKILIGEVALDNLKTILEDKDVENVLGVKNSVTVLNTKKQRILALEMLNEVKEKVSLANSSGKEDDVKVAGALVKDFLLKAGQSLTYAYSMLEATVTSASFTEAQLSSYKTLVTSQNSQVSAAATAVETAIQSFSNAILNHKNNVATASENLRQAQVALSNAILSAENNLSSIKLAGSQQITAAQARLENAQSAVNLSLARYNNVIAPARSQDIALARAQVDQAKASLESIETTIKNSIITAPLAGVITQVNYNVGEQFGSSGKAMITMLADGNFDIEVDISESDINKVKIGDSVEVTLDAFSNDIIIPARVYFIEPAQTLIQGVVYYKVEITFDDLENLKARLAQQGLSLKSGMTANVTITTNKKENVISIPARAVIEEEGNKIVRVLSGGQMIKVPVKTGLRGDEGLIEILDGIYENDEVITFVKSTQ